MARDSHWQLLGRGEGNLQEQKWEKLELGPASKAAGSRLIPRVVAVAPQSWELRECKASSSSTVAGPEPPAAQDKGMPRTVRAAGSQGWAGSCMVWAGLCMVGALTGWVEPGWNGELWVWMESRRNGRVHGGCGWSH